MCIRPRASPPRGQGGDGGFYLVEAADLEEALELAAGVACPGAQHGAIEVRQAWEVPG
ncbi:MAG: YciI family protein [Candidatus Limnocylindria bacterium]